MGDRLHSSIIIPFYLEKKGKNNSMDELVGNFAKIINTNTNEWKSINDSAELFEGGVGTKDENKEAEYEYFLDEVVRVLYSGKGNTIRSIVRNVDDTLTIEAGKYNFKPNKIYIDLTHTGTGAMTIEFDEKDPASADMLSSLADEADAGSIFYQLTDCNDKSRELIKLPYGKRVFAAAYYCSVNDNADSGMDNTVEPVIMNNYIMRHGDENGLMDFFAHYFQIFTIVIIQRTELLRISALASSMASDISNKANDSIIKDYTLFKNQYDFVECTVERDGQNFYRNLRSYYHINDKINKLENQIDALNAYISAESSKKTNGLLTALSALAIVSVLVDGTDYFNEYLIPLVAPMVGWIFGKLDVDGSEFILANSSIISTVIVAVIVLIFVIVYIRGSKKGD